MARNSNKNPPWISAGRFQKYMDAAHGDPVLALEIYSWNVDLSAALFRDFAYLEVALRNACDKAMFRRGGQIAGGADWLKSEANTLLVLPTRSHAQATVIKLRNRLADAREYSGFNNNPSIPRGKILAELSFGFWKYLFTREMAHDLWDKGLALEFRHVDPAKTVNPAKIHLDLEKFAKLRNRIAHHESIFDKSPQVDHDALLRVTELLGPSVNAFVRNQSTFRKTIANPPK